jgi:hypothetical protein
MRRGHALMSLVCPYVHWWAFAYIPDDIYHPYLHVSCAASCELGSPQIPVLLACHACTSIWYAWSRRDL